MSEYTTDHDLKSYEDMSCGYQCHTTKEYGFVPEAGCPIHDDGLDNIQKRAYKKCQKSWNKLLK
jgi:hypothetical protein